MDNKDAQIKILEIALGLAIKERDKAWTKLDNAERLLYAVVYGGELWKNDQQLHKKIEQFLVN